ncbi:MAG TPA: DUF554 domain-containing protein, partial [Verrucomicrobiae bacterium]|nr:DUF554 domain-containing protein [Verrucomicrobiae bacterium]
TGSILNAIGIFVGGICGLILARQLAASTQLGLRGLMGIITVLVGLHMTWAGLNGSFFQVFKQIVIMILALMLGSIIGRLLHIQRGLNLLGQYATKRFEAARPDDPNRWSEGFTVCALLFCAGPLGPIGAIEDGLLGNWQPLAIKMVMDGLAAMGFVGIFGWGVVLSAVPVLAYQGTITLLAHRLEPLLQERALLDSVSAVGGMLVFCVALIVMELKKIQLGDYLPSLAVAPLITWLWR